MNKLSMEQLEAVLPFSQVMNYFIISERVYASTKTEEEHFVFDSETGTINGYKDSGPKDVVIPSKIGGISVQAIGERAFYNNKLKSVIIPDSVTSISYGTFAYNQLESVTIPNSVTSIGDGAFYENQLQSVMIPDSVTTIGDYAFNNNQLESVMIPNSVTTIGNAAFSDNQLKSVTISDGVETIGYGAFSNNQLESLSIPNSVTSIGTWAFEYNQLKSVSILNNKIIIGNEAFSNNQQDSYSLKIYSYDSSTAKLYAEDYKFTFVNKLEVHFNELNGIPLVTKTVEFGSLIDHAATTTNDSYTFAGWYNNAELTEPWDIQEDMVIEDNLSLYAKWTKTPSSGGGSSSPGPIPTPNPNPNPTNY